MSKLRSELEGLMKYAENNVENAIEALKTLERKGIVDHPDWSSDIDWNFDRIKSHLETASRMIGYLWNELEEIENE